MLQHLNSDFVCGPNLQPILDKAAKAAESGRPVLVTGESGTGKRWLARHIHDCSDRRDKPFVTWSAPAESETLGRRQLFGHIRGAFTGADQDSPGALEAAHTGTLVLDDIDKTSLDLQGALLHLLDGWAFKRLGSNRETRVDVRWVATANRSFSGLIQADLFLPDLAYRLMGLRIHIPPLRQRQKDLPMMIRHYMDHFAEVHARKSLDISKGALRLLISQPWPGNVRQLSGTIENLVFHGPDSGLVEVRDVKRVLFDDFQSGEGRVPARRGCPGRDEVIKTLDQARWNSVQASKAYSVSPRTFRRWMQDYGLRRDG